MCSLESRRHCQAKFPCLTGRHGDRETEREKGGKKGKERSNKNFCKRGEKEKRRSREERESSKSKNAREQRTARGSTRQRDIQRN